MVKDLLFIALADPTSESDGVGKKVKAEAMALCHNGHDVDLMAYHESGIALYHVETNGIKLITHVKGGKFRKTRLYKEVESVVKRDQYKVAYIRYPMSSKPFNRMLSKIKDCGTIINLECATYPIKWSNPVSVKEAIKHSIFRYQEKKYSGELKKYVDVMYHMGDPATEIYGIKGVNIPNGVSAENMPLRKPIDSPQDELRILFCANFYNFHGVDRLIEGLKQYYQKSQGKGYNIYLELVGGGPEVAVIKQLVEKYKLEKYVNFHGILSGKDYDDIFDRCQMASSCLAFHRVQQKYASNLKAKDYIMRGIPYIYSYIETGLGEDFPYAMHFEADESPINIESVLEFYETYKNDQVNVASRMREYGMEHFTWEKILKDV